jgi:hypothetical protein
MARISLYYYGIYYACYQHIKTLNNTNYLLPCTYDELRKGKYNCRNKKTSCSI